MRVRAKFEKRGAAAYVSHLDMLRTFQRTINRARLPVLYSQGFNPHQKVMFAQALRLGMESRGEYFEAAFADGTPLESIVNDINRHAPEGIVVTSVREVDPSEPNAMAAVAAAAYTYTFAAPLNDAFAAAVDLFFARDDVLVLKKTKNGMQQWNIRPLVYAMTVQGDTMDAVVSCGEQNVKPEQLVCAVAALADMEPPEADIVRTEIFRRAGDGGLLPL